jgi:hypothetical protein
MEKNAADSWWIRKILSSSWLLCSWVKLQFAVETG